MGNISHCPFIHEAKLGICVKLQVREIVSLHNYTGEGWTDGTGVNYNNWEDGEPNSGTEQCTEIIPHSGKWNDAPCDAHRYYLCKTKKSKCLKREREKWIEIG